MGERRRPSSKILEQKGRLFFSRIGLSVFPYRQWPHCRGNYVSAGCAQCAFLEIDPLHGVGGGHNTEVVLTVRQVQSVSEFMDRFFDHALAKQFMVGRKAIEFLTKPVSRDHGAGATYLRLAEN